MKRVNAFDQRVDQIIKDILKYRKIGARNIKQGEKMIKLLDQINNQLGKVANKVGVEVTD